MKRVMLVALGMLLGACQLPPDVLFEIDSPAPGAVFHTNSHARITVLNWEQSYLTATAISAEGERIELGEGVMGIGDAFGYSSLIWPLKDVKPGPYTIEVARPDHEPDRVPVIVRAPPKVDLSVTSSKPDGEGVYVTFAAKVASVAPIVSYVWWRDREKRAIRTEKPEVTVRYPGLGRDAEIALEVVDSDGGRFLATSLLTIPGSFPTVFFSPLFFRLRNANTCGCKEMVVSRKAGENSQMFCHKPIPGKPDTLQKSLKHCKIIPGRGPPGPGARKCPAGQLAYTCPLGPLKPSTTITFGGGGPLRQSKPFSFGFEVMASLTDKSAPDKCVEGQVAKASFSHISGTDAPVDAVKKSKLQVHPKPKGGVRIRLPGRVGANPQAPMNITPEKNDQRPAKRPLYPKFTEAKWGSDDYTEISDVKEYLAGDIHWIDVPGFTTATKKIRPGGGVTFSTADTAKYEADFVAYVLGTTGEKSCWCRFKVRQTWTKATKKIGKITVGGGEKDHLEIVGGVNCNDARGS